jgi:nitrite reductase/ring-hydroxylating ferredoxin subunit
LEADFVSDNATISRRSVLAAGCAGAVACGAALAGCSSSDSGGTPGANTTTDPGGATSGGSSTGAGATSAPNQGGAALAKVADIPAGGSLQVMSDGKPVILFRDGNAVTGHSAVCTHMGTVIPAGGAELTCPNHGSKFNAQTGAVLNGPAAAPLPEVKVTVSGDSVMAG